jgi:serine protease
VGATTSDACLADYSNSGRGLDIVAPGGGQDAPLASDPYDQAHCDPSNPDKKIVQETISGGFSKFKLVGFEGTSFATPHVTAAAALLIATKRLGAHPTPSQIKARLMQTATDLGPTGYDSHYGAGLLNIPAALSP